MKIFLKFILQLVLVDNFIYTVDLKGKIDLDDIISLKFVVYDIFTPY